MYLPPVFSLLASSPYQSDVTRSIKTPSECHAEQLKQNQTAHGGPSTAMRGDNLSESTPKYTALDLLMLQIMKRLLREMHVENTDDDFNLLKLLISLIAESNGVSPEL